MNWLVGKRVKVKETKQLKFLDATLNRRIVGRTGIITSYLSEEQSFAVQLDEPTDYLGDMHFKVEELEFLAS